MTSNPSFPLLNPATAKSTIIDARPVSPTTFFEVVVVIEAVDDDADGDGDGFISSADIKRLLHKRVKEGEEVAGKKARLRRSSSKKDVTNLAGAGG